MSSLVVEICQIDDIQKHPNADKLSIVTVKGWRCIVGLDQYKVGDRVVFIPPDCILPEDLIKKYDLDYVRSNGRTKTVKLRGFVSQGLILDVPEGEWHIGDDVAKFLGITKWQPPEPKYAVNVPKTSRKYINPKFDKYTDIENVKHYPYVFREGDMVVITEKIHGANWRASRLPIAIRSNARWYEKIAFWFRKNIFEQEQEYLLGSHNVQITHSLRHNNYYGEDYWGEVAKKYNVNSFIPENTILYGEVYGSNVQDLTYGLNGRDLVIFDIKQDGRYLDWEDVVEFCNKHSLKHVPVLYIGKYYNGILQKYSDGKSLICQSQMREGCVIKTLKESNDFIIGRKILKSISSDYLTRQNGTEYQ